MKKFILFLLVILFTLLIGCADITATNFDIDEREYQKIAYTLDMYKWAPCVSANQETTPICVAPQITCYDDVVMYGKSAFNTIYGFEHTLPYFVHHDEKSGWWLFETKSTYADGNEIKVDQNFSILFDSEGKVLVSFPSLPSTVDTIDAIDTNTSNAFVFSYDDFDSYSGYTIYNEKLEKVTCAQDVIDNAMYLYDKWNIPYYDYYAQAVCYDEENDCWLYIDNSDAALPPVLTMVISSDGEILVCKFKSEYALS